MNYLRSKTMNFALLLAVLGAVQAGSDVFRDLLTPQMYGLFTLATGVVVAVLRVVTTQPISEK